MAGKKAARQRERGPRIPPAEALLLEVAPELPGERVLATTLSDAPAARAVAAARPEAAVACWTIDLRAARAVEEAGELPPGLEVACRADAPEGERDLVLAPTSKRQETELVRDVVQAGYRALREGGLLVASTDDPKDALLLGILERLGKGLRRDVVKKRGVVYRLEKKGPLRKVKDYRCELAFRHRGELLKLVTRPGVFAHRRLDLGARVLTEALEVVEGERVLDVGCGSGAASIAAAFEGAAGVVAVDANARAVACAAEGAALNGLADRIRAEHARAEAFEPPAAFDLAVCRPPSGGRVAAAQLDLAARALKPGGRVLVATKQPRWFLERLPDRFEEVRAEDIRAFVVVSGERA